MISSPPSASIRLYRWVIACLLLLMAAASAQNQWVASDRHGDEVRFLYGDQIRRYSLKKKSWLNAFTLTRGNAAAMGADGNGAVVAYGNWVYRYNPSFTGETLVGTTSSAIQSVFLDGNLVIAVHSSGLYGRVTVFDRTTGATLSSIDTYIHSIYGASHAKGSNRIYGRTQGISPEDIVTTSYTDAGVLEDSVDSPYHGGFPSATKSWVFPDGGRVVDSSGTVYTTPDLSYSGSLAGGVTDIAFNGNVPVILRDSELITFNPGLMELARGSVTATENSELQVTATQAFVFNAAGGDPSVQVIPLSKLKAPKPGASVDPTGLAYTVDDAFLDKDGNVLLFSKEQKTLFRWSPGARKYTGSFPLLGEPQFAAYSKENHAAYFAYETQTVRKMDLAAAKPKESALFNLPAAPQGLATAGSFIFANDFSGAWGTHYLFSPKGVMTHSLDWNYNSPAWEWDPSKRRMYFFRDSSPSDLHYETIDASGRITGDGETPYHGDFTADPPIRVSPDGERVVIGSGVVFNTEDMTRAANLSNGFSDAVWRGDKLVTLRLINGVTQLQTWEGAQFLPGETVRQFSGTPLRLFDTSAGLLTITSVDGAPRFTLLDAAFNTIYGSPTKPVAPEGLAVTTRTYNSVTLQWQDMSDNESGFRMEYRSANGKWTTGATVGAGVTSAKVSGLKAAKTYEFRVVAMNGGLVSEPSSEVAGTTLKSAKQPVGEPYFLTITRALSDTITLEWQDNGLDETGFRIYRSTSPFGKATVLSVPADATSFTDTGVEANTTYYYRLQIVKDKVAGDLSARVDVTTPDGDVEPLSPDSLTAVAASAFSVVLSWSDNSTNEDEFIIERADGAQPPAWTELARVGYNVETYTDVTVMPMTFYSYRVKASNSAGSSTSNIVSGATPSVGGQFAGHSTRVGDLYYFAFRSPHRIERYDLASRSWLTAIPLEAAPVALWVDESGIFVAEDRAVIRFSLDGSGRTPLGNAQDTVRALFTTGNVLAFSTGDRDREYITMNKLNGSFLSTFSYWNTGTGFSSAAGLNRIFFRSTNVSPSDIHYLEIGADGKLIKGAQSPYHGDYSGGTRTFVFPNGARVADDSGNVYSTDSLIHTNSLGGYFTDLSFHGQDIPIVLRGDKLQSYTNALTQAGGFTLPGVGLRVAVNQADAIVFSVSGGNVHGLSVQAVPLSQLSAPVPGQPVDPNGLAYTPDDVFVDKNGEILLFAKSQLSLFRWSPASKQYLATCPLVGVPSYAGYSKETHRAYFAYDSQVVRMIDLSAATPVETPLFGVPGVPRGFTMAGEFPYSATSNGLMTYTPDGTPITNSGPTSYTGSHNTWDPVKRRVYHFRDGVSPNDLHYDTISASGTITGSGESPYHGGFTINPPIRVNPEGTRIAIGGGAVFEATGLTRLATLPSSFVDALWRTDELLTIHPAGTKTLMRRWNGSTFAEGATVPYFAGVPLRLISLDAQGLLLITLDGGKPRFYLLNADLTVAYDSAAQGISPLAENSTQHDSEISPSGSSASITGSSSRSMTVMGAAGAVVEPFAVKRIARQEDGGMLIEFTAQPGKRYQIEYSGNGIYWKSCPAPIEATGTTVEWIDRGPPSTECAPSESSRRLYRVTSLDD